VTVPAADDEVFRVPQPERRGVRRVMNRPLTKKCLAARSRTRIH
jgi:hypothetical protein